MTRKQIVENLKRGHLVHESLRTGLDVTWRESIDNESARALAGALFERGDATANVLAHFLPQLRDKGGWGEVIRAAVDRVSGADSVDQWFLSNRATAKLLLQHASTVSTACQERLQRRVAGLLTEHRSGNLQQALELLKSAPALSPEVRQELEELAKANAEPQGMLAKELLAKPLLS